MADGEPVASVYSHQRTRVNRILFAELDTLLRGAGVRLRDLDLIVVARGPGSFTGTRLGLGVAQTFAAVAGIPLIGVDTLALLAAQTDPATPGPIHAVLNCAREEVYHADFQWAEGRIEAMSPLRLLDIESLADELGAASAPAIESAPAPDSAPKTMQSPAVVPATVTVSAPVTVPVTVVLRRFAQRGVARPTVEAQFARLHTFQPDNTMPLRHPVPDGLRLLSVGVANYRQHLADSAGKPLAPAEPVYLKSEAFRTWRKAEQRPA